jgi:hypothetical protein
MKMQLSTNRPRNIDRADPAFTVLPPQNESAAWNVEEENFEEDEEKDNSKGQRNFYLTKEDLSSNRREMDSLIKSLDITWAKEKRKLTGTKPLTDGSLIAYAKHYRGLLYFLTLIGDFKSMLILQEDAPLHLCPSVDARSISLYYKWKLLPRGTPLEGTDLICTGAWKDPRNMDQFRAAMMALHKSRGQSGPYQVPCEDCLKKYAGCMSSENFVYQGGCRAHLANPVLWLVGNPVTSNIVEDCAKSLFKLHSAYIAKGDSAVTPSELLKIRGKLLSSNSIYDYLIWTMIIIACKLFLREDEVSSMHFEDIVPDVTSVHSNGMVEGIAFTVQGKSDAHPVTLMMWSDHVFPHLCPVNALLSWLSLSKIKSGYIFPSFNFLKEVAARKDWDGAVTEEADIIPYSTFLDRFKKLCKQLLDPDRGPFGTHTCRKTAYLLGVWGGASESQLMRAARHKSIQNALKYKKDADYCLELARSSPNDVSLGTPTWRPIWCENHQLARSVNGNLSNFKSLEILAANYNGIMERKIGRPIKTPLDFAEACSLTVSDFDKLEKSLQVLLNRVAHKLSPEEAFEIKQLFSQLSSEVQFKNFPTNNFVSQVEDHQAAVPSSTSIDLTTENATTSNNPPEENIPKKRKLTRGGAVEYPYKSVAKLKDPEKKLIQILEFRNSVPADKNELEENCRKWYYETICPVYKCYTNHCNSQTSVFLGRWKKFSPSKFYKKCEGVAGEPCGGLAK